LALRQPFASLGILIFTERVKLFARDFRLGVQSQPLRTHADPPAGPDFAGGVIIVLRQVLDEIAFGGGQLFMRDAGEHKTQS
jgi:hypothetical protein